MHGINNVGNGWHELVKDLEDQLSDLDLVWELFQIKEKFGGLRYYAVWISGTADAKENGQQFINEAETVSYELCEECGSKPSAQRNDDGYWKRTLCEEHRRLHREQYAEQEAMRRDRAAPEE